MCCKIFITDWQGERICPDCKHSGTWRDGEGWLPHTVRAALTRLRQRGFQIVRVREDGVSRYRIAEDRKAA